MASQSNTPPHTPQDRFVFKLAWKVPPELIEEGHAHKWAETSVGVDYDAPIDRLIRMIRTQIKSRIEDRKDFYENGLEGFFTTLGNFTKPKAKKTCWMIRFATTLSAEKNVSPPSTISLDEAIRGRFADISDLADEPELLRKRKLKLDVELRLEKCRSEVALDNKVTLDRFVIPEAQRLDYVHIGSVQALQVKEYQDLLTTVSDEIPQRKNVILGRFQDVNDDIMDDEVRVSSSWLFGPGFKIGDPEGSYAYSLGEICEKGTKLSMSHQTAVDGKQQNVTLKELKEQAKKKRGESTPTRVPPKLPPLSLAHLDDIKNVLPRGVKCPVVVRCVYHLTTINLSESQKRYPRNMQIEISKTTMLDNSKEGNKEDVKEDLQELMLRASANSVNDGISKDVNPRKMICEWWIMREGATMGKMHRIEAGYPLVRYISNAPSRNETTPLYTECHMWEGANNTPKLHQGL